MNGLPTDQEIRNEQDPVRRDLLRAIVRLIEGRPLHVPPGHLTAVALANEAEHKRHWLNGAHRDLRDRFAELRAAAAATTGPTNAELADQVEAMEAMVADLKQRLATSQADATQWKTAAEVFIRALSVQEREIANLKIEVERLRRSAERAGSAGRTPDDLASRRVKHDR